MTTNNIDVIYVPWYLKSNLDAVGMDIDELKNSLECRDTKLAISDVYDMYVANYMVIRNLFTTINSRIPLLFDLKSYIYMDREQYIKKEIDLINLLSISNNEFINTFNLIYSNNTIYVILKEGFTNFIKFNNQNDKEYFIRSLTNFMFKHFSSKDVFSSVYFKTFLNLKTKI